MSSYAATYAHQAAPDDKWAATVRVYDRPEYGFPFALREERDFVFGANARRWAADMRDEGYLVEVEYY